MKLRLGLMYIVGAMLLQGRANGEIFEISGRAVTGTVSRIRVEQGLIELEQPDHQKQIFKIDDFSQAGRDYIGKMNAMQQVLLRHMKAAKERKARGESVDLAERVASMRREMESTSGIPIEPPAAESGAGGIAIILGIIGLSCLFIFFGRKLKSQRIIMERDWIRLPAKIIGMNKDDSFRHGNNNRADTTLSLSFEYGGKTYKIMSQYMNVSNKYIADDFSTEVLLDPSDPEKSVHYIAALHYMAPRVLIGVGSLFIVLLVMIFLVLERYG